MNASAPGPAPVKVPRVLLAEESLPYRRVLREALTTFRACDVDDVPSAERAFEMALHREYSLFIFSLHLPDMTGEMLDRLVSRTYPRVHPGVHAAPPVIFLCRSSDLLRLQELQRDVRVRGSLPLPPKLDVLLSLTASLLPERSAPALPLAPPAFPPALTPQPQPPPHVS